jgi:3-demethoxyubiquinol 3-hydroxylase
VNSANPYSVATDLGDRIIKVNHAGEHGAISIYTGQIHMARFTARDLVEQLIEFRSEEQKHRAIFQAELQRRGRPRCRSYWLCGIGGYVLGLITGLMGRSAIAATTVAVESVVLKHLEHQLATLGDRDPEATAAISVIVAEERQHHDQSEVHLEGHPRWRAVIEPVAWNRGHPRESGGNRNRGRP